MARMYKIGKTGTAMTGKEFVKKANKLFYSEIHGYGRSGKPVNLKKAINFVDRELGKEVYTKLSTEKSWKWVGFK